MLYGVVPTVSQSVVSAIWCGSHSDESVSSQSVKEGHSPLTDSLTDEAVRGRAALCVGDRQRVEGVIV